MVPGLASLSVSRILLASFANPSIKFDSNSNAAFRRGVFLCLDDMWNWFNKKRNRKLLDSFALLDSGKWKAIQKAVRDVESTGQATLLVTHFPSTFEWVQSNLEHAGLSYSIAPQRLDRDAIGSLIPSGKAPHSADTPVAENSVDAHSLHLLLAAQLEFAEGETRSSPLPREAADQLLSVIVCERHPVAHQDRQLQMFFESLPWKTQLGYFLSLEEPLIRAAIGENAVVVMQQLGLNEHELITSQILTRRIDRFTKKFDERQDLLDADSPGDWLDANSSV